MLASRDEKSSNKVSETTMTASTRGTMRPNGRSPPFLAIGLFIALCVMGFNYWNLSAKNAEQANEISILSSEKLTARAASEKRIENLNGQVDNLQRDLNMAKTQKVSETNRLAEEKRALEEQINRERSEASEELTKCRELTNELKTQVDGFKCGSQECESQTVAAREQAFNEVYKFAGIGAMLKLRQADVNLGSLGEQLRAEFEAEIQRQQQLAQLQQGELRQAALQPNQAADQQQGQAGLQVEQNKGANETVHFVHKDPNLPVANAAGQVVGGQENKEALQPIVGIQPGEGIQKEAGGQNEAGFHIEAGHKKEADGQNEAGYHVQAGNHKEVAFGNLGDHLREQKGDVGVVGDSNQHVLPKPGYGNVSGSLKNATGQPLNVKSGTATSTTTPRTKLAYQYSNVEGLSENQRQENAAGQSSINQTSTAPSNTTADTAILKNSDNENLNKAAAVHGGFGADAVPVGLGAGVVHDGFGAGAALGAPGAVAAVNNEAVRSDGKAADNELPGVDRDEIADDMKDEDDDDDEDAENDQDYEYEDDEDEDQFGDEDRINALKEEDNKIEEARKEMQIRP